MRAIIISILALFLLLASWGFFFVFAQNNINDMVDIISEKAMVEVKLENWQNCQETVESINSKWQESRKLFSLFFDAGSIGEIEGSFARLQAYISGEEMASSLGELAYLRQQLLFMLENEMVTIENIF